MDSNNLALLKKELINDEGLKLNVYQDSVGLWTIGVGHLLGTERRMMMITEAEAGALLDFDIQIALHLAYEYVPDLWADNEMKPFGKSRARAIVNMAFNLGPRLKGFVNFLKAVNAKDWPTAAKEMMYSKWATQVGARAERLRNQILTED